MRRAGRLLDRSADRGRDTRMRDLTQREVWSVQQAWRVVFARRLHRLTGKWTQGSDRYVFRPNGMLKYLTGAAAAAEYASAEASGVYVIDDDGGCGEFRQCPHGQKPPLVEFVEKTSVIIFPTDFAWSAAVGSEYWDRIAFTYREWVDDADSLPEEPRK